MDYPPFYRTRRGEVFFGKQLLELIRAIERLADALERIVAERKGEGQEDDRANA